MPTIINIILSSIIERATLCHQLLLSSKKSYFPTPFINIILSNIIEREQHSAINSSSRAKNLIFQLHFRPSDPILIFTFLQQSIENLKNLRNLSAKTIFIHYLLVEQNNH